MKKLKKFKLDFNLTWIYFRENLDQVNTLSTNILKVINSFDGNFFTLLPENVNYEQIHIFSDGGILFQPPDREYVESEIKSKYSTIPSIDDELAVLIFYEIQSQNNFSCIFDDVNCSPENSKGCQIFDNYGLSYMEESYYLLKKNEITIKLIKECMNISNAFWHSLCLFTKADFTNRINFLDSNKMVNNH